MAYRGFFALDGQEITNSSRVVGHLGYSTPQQDAGIVCSEIVLDEDPDGSGLYLPGPLPVGSAPAEGGELYYPGLEGEGECGLTEASPLLYEIPDSSVAVGNFWSPPDGSERYGPGLIEVDGNCWGPSALCGCRLRVQYDDSWPGLRAFLGDTVYRSELAPWHSSRVPESAEFGGIWVMDVTGFGPAPIERSISNLIGDGASAGPHRDAARVLTFSAVLIACTNAGLEYGLNWLTCQLRDTARRTDARLTYFTAHPSHTTAPAASLLRDFHGVVLTKAPAADDVAGKGVGPNQQATMYRVSWEMTVLNPHSYRPPVELPIEWDTVTVEPIEWSHAASCPTCEPDEPVLFSTECAPERLVVGTTPPPVCGGCMPICAVDRYVTVIPSRDYALRCGDTVVNVEVENRGVEPLTLQLYLRRCGSNEACAPVFPLQVSGLVPGATLMLDSVSGRYHAEFDGKRRRPVGIVGTPSGAPWTPIVFDRSDCWELVAEAADGADFAVKLTLIDRES